MVKSVDLHHTVLKGSAAEKWQPVVQQRQETAHMEFALEPLKETDAEKERVRYFEPKEEVTLREEEKERRNGEHYEVPGEQISAEPEERKEHTHLDETEEEHQINILA